MLPQTEKIQAKATITTNKIEKTLLCQKLYKARLKLQEIISANFEKKIICKNVTNY